MRRRLFNNNYLLRLLERQLKRKLLRLPLRPKPLLKLPRLKPKQELRLLKLLRRLPERRLKMMQRLPEMLNMPLKWLLKMLLKKLSSMLLRLPIKLSWICWLLNKCKRMPSMLTPLKKLKNFLRHIKSKLLLRKLLLMPELPKCRLKKIKKKLHLKLKLNCKESLLKRQELSSWLFKLEMMKSPRLLLKLLSKKLFKRKLLLPPLPSKLSLREFL